MNRPSAQIKAAARRMSRYRRSMKALVGVMAIMAVVEVVEHLLILRFGAGIHEVFDGLIFFLLLPGVTWLMFARLDQSERGRAQAVRDNNLSAEFNQKLWDACSWDERMQRLVEYAHRMAPSADLTLYVPHPDSGHLLPEAACSRCGQVTLKPEGGPPASPPQVSKATLPHRFDLPMTRTGAAGAGAAGAGAAGAAVQIGLLALAYPPDSPPGPEEMRGLHSAAPLMALALEGALLQRLAAGQAAASEAQRQQIAQNLHDSLAQNISYLRLKLDQLTGENAVHEIGAVLQELERMRTTADEAYQQVRNTLDELNPTQADDLTSALVRQASAICRRAGVNLRHSQAGTPYALPATARQQILYIVREGVHNIEKHARARQAHLQLLWLEHELIIKISDDGVGFDPLTVPGEGHYGLWIMQQRARELGGTLKICPAEDHGTEVTLWVPREASPTVVDHGGPHEV